ncbi:hypothetical protein CHS0354_001635 [Potamilus streckersoni]|uniref:Uncharacterized protein n=1 Tax=Potamilus streckersoni TaxID=2493646 RepID=A0AAE0VZ84_9BIVA|nr:hypothetical protein CHS0354_001635 [Potamilus streckersoni]
MTLRRRRMINVPKAIRVDGVGVHVSAAEVHKTIWLYFHNARRGNPCQRLSRLGQDNRVALNVSVRFSARYPRGRLLERNAWLLSELNAQLFAVSPLGTDGHAGGTDVGGNHELSGRPLYDTAQMVNQV